MICKMIFRKKIKKIVAKELEKEKEGLNKKLDLERQRLGVVKYLLETRGTIGTRCVLEKTSIGNNVLVFVNESEYEVDVFNIDKSITELSKIDSSLWVKLWPKTRKKEVFVQDKCTGNDNGFLEIAMKHLFEFVDEVSKEKIAWKIKDIDNCVTKDELIALYESMGFAIKHFSDNRKTVDKK
ncbi:hypothetical protein [Tenacibaculum caenipelagi]|uniref:Uncharacterized protein n=1 Tax=Tenacibaculum caenipelagi TaxID=1325435 RepID=A0A4R6TJ15_9FLAO|nr:hypothetical protein [Tenacibaculum caenipelagi]TDQ30376.1 hypothetical protein DFQ07_0719 [Tenacibaculum caenipelagi]